MYKIIGGDQQQYGPVSADEIRRWITQGRANAQTMAWAEGAPEWKPLSAFPEFADLLGAAAPLAAATPAAGTRLLTPEELLARDYDLDIGNCLSRGWQLLKLHFWPIVGISLLVGICIFVINQLLGLLTRPAINDMVYHHHVSPGGIGIILAISFLSTPLYTILIAGLYRYYIALIRGEPAGVGTAFSGFGPAIGHLVLLGLATGFLNLIAFCLCVLPGIYTSVAWMFAIPLVIDRGLGFWQAMELSRRLVTRHWFLVFALVLVVGLVSVAGVIACCVGLLATVPLGWMSLMYAYEDIFGRRTA
ncbi:MAG TPA: GYF domain-containing protein [Candidatus Acidoferrum sp.]|nr:GYF domain-containing protein [Candidatus Acidoferrum sp.]